MLATVAMLSGLICLVFQVSAQIGFVLAAMFFLMHKVMLFQEAVSATMKIESTVKNDSKD